MNDAQKPSPTAGGAGPEAGTDFVRERVIADRSAGRWGDRVATRFPPEPNGYLHIGHAKSICLNFGIAAEFGGVCHLRFDDTNPLKESQEYIDSILTDVRWLGFDWGEHLYYASDYFERLYQSAEILIERGKAYVDDLTADEIREHRGTLTVPGRESPCRHRPIAENLDLFRRMRAGEFPDGSKVLRAKIDMASPNINLRDPTLYRIRRAHHHRSADKWCIYPMYDFTHCLSDSFERITQSICTLEFENNRPLYDWVLDEVGAQWHPQQIEFARLNLSFSVLSKRKLLQLVEGAHVSGWDDPRMPTISGLRRRGVTPEALRTFCERIGVAKRDSTVDMALFEHTIRDDLNTRVPRAMCVMRPLRVVIDNWPADRVEEIEAPNFPDDPPRMGSRRVMFSRELFIERDDFMEAPPKKFYRLSPGREVRLRWAGIVRCEQVIKDPQTGEPTEVHCQLDPATFGGGVPEGRKVQGTIHWVSAAHAVPVRVRLYDRLFAVERPEGDDFLSQLNPRSLEEIPGALAEASLAAASPGERFQFERTGYFFADPVDSKPGIPVFNRILPLRDSWAKIAARS